MQLADKVLVHQVHPVKIGVGIAASVASNILLWQERPKAALAVRVLLPVAGSVAILGRADLDTLARTRRGRYVLAHMPRRLRWYGCVVMPCGPGASPP